VVGPLDPPPAPPTSNVPQPSGTITSPNLRVLPWAGFKAAISYTFDDTQPSQTEHWPELAATGVPMTFFANPSGNWQSGFDAAWTAAAAAGSEIGNHTWSHCHPDLTGCTPVGTAEAEIDNTTTYIISHFGVTAVYSFAAPFGDTGWNTYAAPRFLVGRGVMSGMVPPSGQADWYNLPVFQVAAGQTATEFDAGIDSARSQGRWSIFMFHSILPTTNNWFAGVDIAGITASIAYAASLGDVWMDTFTEVGAYARAQQMFEGLTPSTNTWTWTLPAHFPPGKVLRVTVDGGTLSQGGASLGWDSHGYYEVALDAGTLTWSS
jgi:peptidoglycan/xylan/chitin deacetylase (PgdA/CDA1 family)